MTPQELLLEVFCLVDDELQALNLGRLRQRGPKTKLSDSEVITIELVGAFWKLGTDQDLFRHFRRYHAAEFPALARLHRTTFARQAANLWRVKQLIQQRLARRLAGGDPLWLVDSLPIDACQFARATFCRRFAGQADYGYCHLRKRTFYGFRLHLRTSRDGIVLGYHLAPARARPQAGRQRGHHHRDRRRVLGPGYRPRPVSPLPAVPHRRVPRLGPSQPYQLRPSGR